MSAEARSRMIPRRRTRRVLVGNVAIGGGAPVSVQSMTKTHTEDVDATLAQIRELAEIGCEIIRCAVPHRKAVAALRRIVADSPLPVVADIHFDHHLALGAIEAGAAGVRVNPGNMHDQKGLREVYRAAAQAGVKVRIGVNSGSIRPRKGLEVDRQEGDEDLVELMVSRTLDYCRAAEEEGLGSLVLSLKASDVLTTIAAYRAAAERCDYPLHLGVTAAGPPEVGIVKSAVALGILLAEGIGDTVRVSLTGPPHREVEVAWEILTALGLRERRRPEIISCPTCGRCEFDLVGLVRQVAEALRHAPPTLRVAVMGCVVNGPGEARDADIGVAGGKAFGYIFRRGELLRKVPADRLGAELLAEIRKLGDTQ